MVIRLPADRRIGWKEPAIVLGVLTLGLGALSFGRDLLDITMPWSDAAPRPSATATESVGKGSISSPNSGDKSDNSAERDDDRGSGGNSGGSSGSGNTGGANAGGTSGGDTGGGNTGGGSSGGGNTGGGDSQEPIPDVRVAVNPEISISPVQGQAGSSFTVTGHGFTPRGGITVRFHTDRVAEGTADGDGNFSFTARVPASYGVFAPQNFTVRSTDDATLHSDTKEFGVVL